MPPSSFPEAWGGVTISILVSAALNGGIIIQACSYFSRFWKDPLVLKCAVAVIWLSCFLQLGFEYWILHSIIVLGYDMPFSDVSLPIGSSIETVLEVIVHATTQGTYIFRMYRFGRNPYILASCCVLVLAELGLGFTWVERTINPRQAIEMRDQRAEWNISSFFIISAFIDVFITMSMSYQLMRSRVNGLKQTRHLIDKIIRWTLPTGLLTSSVAIAVVLMWNFQRDSFVWVGICTFAPECYAIGLLALLNARRESSTAIDSDHLSLPTTTLSASSIHIGASSSPIVQGDADCWAGQVAE